MMPNAKQSRKHRRIMSEQMKRTTTVSHLSLCFKGLAQDLTARKLIIINR